MKKSITIAFIFLAGIFCSKDILSLFSDFNDSACYMVDDNEEESSKESENKDIDEKDIADEWESGIQQKLYACNKSESITFKRFHDCGICSPYFEINSPPPEFI